MQITNEDNNISIDYKVSGDTVVRTSTFSDGRISKRTLDKVEAGHDMVDLLVNYNFQKINLMVQGAIPVDRVA